MIHQGLEVEAYGWQVSVWYAVDWLDVDPIVQDLQRIGCGGETLSHARKVMDKMGLDCGFTYSSYEKRESVVVIGSASSPEQFFNSLVHEIMHTGIHIAHTEELDLEGEEVCYICGSLAQAMYPIAHLLLGECGCARGAVLSMLHKSIGGKPKSYKEHAYIGRGGRRIRKASDAV